MLITAEFLTQAPHLVTQAQALASAYKNHQKIDDQYLQAMGEALWQALNSSQQAELKARKQLAGLQVVPIIIESNDAAVMQLPWETLYHPEFGFLGHNPAFSVSRHYFDVLQALPKPQAEPLRVLLFSSLPDDLGERERLDSENEQAKVQEVLLASELKGEIELYMPDDGRFDTFKAELQRFKPHVVYLSGHGLFKVDDLKKTATGSFLFEDAQGNGYPVTEAEIATCFTNLPVQLVVLSACLSAELDTRYPDKGLSNALYRAGVPQVIGMRESIFDQAGIQFAKALLGKIADKERVDIALQAARQAIAEPLTGEVWRESQSSPELSALAQTHWCLPQLLSHNIEQPLIDWSFTPKPKTPIPTKELLGQIAVPERFLGRRRELRLWQNRLLSTHHNRLLITGAGGMGKTALASKLIASLTHEGYHLFSISLRPEHDWSEVELAIEMALVENEALKNQYQHLQTKQLPRAKLLEWLLKLSLKRFNNKLILFFDNLESVQDLTTPHTINNSEVQLWLDAALAVSALGLKVLATSRWQLPNWSEELQCALGRPVYGDYVAFARQQALPLTGERLQKAYQVLGGNFRALEYFARAAKTMEVAEETAFLAALGTAEAEAQTDMALAKLLEHCSAEALSLLLALRAYPVAVPMSGVKKLGYLLELAEAEVLLAELLAFSLVEPYQTERGVEYQLAPLVSSYLNQHYEPLTQALLQTAAKFLYWQLEERVNTNWEYKLATHGALTTAGLELDAHRLALDWIVGALSRAGLYTVLLEQWLPPICESSDLKIKAEALGQTGKQNLHLGQFSAALDYLQRSLAITQEIGDKQGEGTTLNNLSQIYDARGDYSTALDYLQRSLAITQEIGNKQVEGTTLNNLSQIYDARGDYSTALDYLQRSLAIQQEIGDKAGEGATLNNLSQIFKARGDYDSALDYLQRSLAITQEIGDKAGEGATLNNLSQIYDARGDYDTALDYLQRSLAIQQEIGDKAGEGATLNNLSALAHARGDYSTALDYLQRSLAIQQEIGDKAGEGTTLNNLSQIFKARGDYSTALDFLQRSLAITQEIGNKAGEGTTLNNLSQIYDARGDYSTALDYLQRSLAIQQEIGDSAGMCYTLFNMGHIHLQNEQVSEALQAWVMVYQIAKKINLAEALKNLENLAEELGSNEGLALWEQLAEQIENLPSS
ncbi:MAG: tetratricopeptide repeat protein [Thiofilum sp.]|nr:tetratricopeptide repeat protein [Thiofilum sp.]